MQTAKESVRVLHSLLTRRKRFTNAPGAPGLDIAYITDRVMVCSFPFELPLFFSRNNATELIKFLEATHKDHYKVYNLCAERKYDHWKFKGRVTEFSVNINEAPPLYTIYSFIKDVNQWLDAHPMNVACVHCDNGRDRTGMLVSAWLLQTRRCLTASHAITFFASVRGGISPCVTIPSQRRYVEYVERVLTEKMPAIKLVVLEKITIYTVPMFNLRGGCSPWFSISKLNKSIFYSKSLVCKFLPFGSPPMFQSCKLFILLILQKGRKKRQNEHRL
jgi:phosphatidylinositol-3,4,5-trisphosphate 3-phosphatase/dual-specificity protein phosphatase PTEN